jgi:hypothetical protein
VGGRSGRPAGSWRVGVSGLAGLPTSGAEWRSGSWSGSRPASAASWPPGSTATHIGIGGGLQVREGLLASDADMATQAVGVPTDGLTD